MGKLKHVVAIIIVLTVLVGGFVYLLPKLTELQGNANTTDTPQSQDSTASQAPPQDTLSFEEKMKEALVPLQTEYSKRKKRHIWTMGGGETIITYLMQASRFIKQNGGTVLYMEELYKLDASVFQGAKLDLLTDKGDTLNIEIQVSRNLFKPGASLLAVAFQATSLTPELIDGLNRLEFPYDLMIPPFGASESFYKDLDKINNKELVLWMAMESTKLNRVHNKLRPLRIHHTEDQIEAIIADAFHLFPEARGIVSRYGEQAVEHKQLLQAILRPAKNRHLWFLDISTNKLSIAPQTCEDMKMTCKSASPYNPDNSVLDDYTNSKMREAKRNGLAVMIVPLNMNALEKLSNLSQKAKKQGTTFTYLSSFMKK